MHFDEKSIELREKWRMQFEKNDSYDYRAWVEILSLLEKRYNEITSQEESAENRRKLYAYDILMFKVREEIGHHFDYIKAEEEFYAEYEKEKERIRKEV